MTDPDAYERLRNNPKRREIAERIQRSLTERHYRCPTCGATKKIRDPHRNGQFPASVPCGWRGCSDRAVES